LEYLKQEVQCYRQPWMADVDCCLASGKRAKALHLLEKVIEHDMPLFRGMDAELQEERRLAWLYRIDLLLETGHLSEALAWTCLECELNPDNVTAQAQKERLKRCLGFTWENPPHASARGDTRPFRWDGVAGMRETKAILERDVILPLEEPELYKKYKVDLPNGILFHGPPGCGKTFIARKLAELLEFNFIEIKPSDLASIYVHGGQEKIGSLFAKAREESPTLLFFDELDALVPNRGGDFVGHHYGAEVNEFLVQLNESWEKGVLVIGATNLLEHIGPAVRRPGRMDKKVFIGPPDMEARVELLKLYMDGRPQTKIDWLIIAQKTDIYSCAELEELCNEAARIALHDRRKITNADLMAAADVVQPSLTPDQLASMRGLVE